MGWTINEKHPEFDNGPAIGFHGTPARMGLRVILDGQAPGGLPDLLGDLAGAAQRLLPGEVKEQVARVRRLGKERAALEHKLAQARAAADEKVRGLEAKRDHLRKTLPQGVAAQLLEVETALADARGEPAALEKQVALLAGLVEDLRGEVAPQVAQVIGAAAVARQRELLEEQVRVARSLVQLPGVAEHLDRLAAVKVALLRAADAANSTALKQSAASQLLAAAAA
jgi:hypothetical protein